MSFMLRALKVYGLEKLGSRSSGLLYSLTSPNIVFGNVTLVYFNGGGIFVVLRIKIYSRLLFPLKKIRFYRIQFRDCWL